MDILSSEPLHYGPAAFDSSKIPSQPRHKWREDSNRSGLFRTTLRWGNYANLEPWQDVSAQLKVGIHNLPPQENSSELYINHQRWTFERSSIFLTLAPFLKWWSIAFFPWILWQLAMIGALSNLFDEITASKGVYIAMSLGIFLVAITLISFGLSAWMTWRDNPKYKQYLSLLFIELSIALTLSLFYSDIKSDGVSPLWLSISMVVIAFMGLVGWDWIADRYFNLLRSAGNEFNRKTGMLTISRRFRSAFTAPFYEFDATMEFRPGPYGSSGTAIWLHHRYYDFEIFLGGKIQSLGMSREECMAFWDTLQRYMDVSQPLPELPFLEQFRDLDPATSAHDKLSNRNPNCWRETKSRVWDRTILPGMMKKNLDYPWQNQGCVLMAKIDPTLTIENYYHAQEAKGIHSTPKAIDYDDIHRG